MKGPLSQDRPLPATGLDIPMRVAMRHLDDRSLIRLSDAEIDERSQASMEAHLAACEKCLSKQRQLGCAMQRFLEFEEILRGATPKTVRMTVQWRSSR